MNESDYHLLHILQKNPLPLIELTHKVGQPNDVQRVWDQAADLCYLGLLNHHAQTGTYGNFGLTDKGRLALIEYAQAFDLPLPA